MRLLWTYLSYNLTMPSYKIRGTKVTLPYPPQLTAAEVRLVFRLQRYFEPTKIFPELYLPRYASRSTLAPLDFMLGAPNLHGSEITQVDCLAVNSQGIFVFESKDYLGYIYGRGNDHFWTQVTQYGKAKYRFYNPIRQNQTHIRALVEILGPAAEQFPIYSVVIFGLDATLKSISDLPEHSFVIQHAKIPELLQKLPQNQLNPANETKILDLITKNRICPTATMRRDHINDTAELGQELNHKGKSSSYSILNP